MNIELTLILVEEGMAKLFNQKLDLLMVLLRDKINLCLFKNSIGMSLLLELI